MIERNNGEDRFNGQPIFSPAPSLTHATFKPKRHNAKYCPFSIRERIVNALAAGDPKRRIARALRVSNNTVTAVAEQEWQQVETRKARIAAQAERAATSAFDRINQKLDSHDDIPLNVLVPVAGVSVDKMIALRGDPSIVARIEHVPGGNIFQAYAELLAAIKARPAPQQLPKAEIKVLPTPQEPKDDECKAPSSSSQAGPSSSSATTQALKDNCPHQTHPRHPQNKR